MLSCTHVHGEDGSFHVASVFTTIKKKVQNQSLLAKENAIKILSKESEAHVTQREFMYEMVWFLDGVMLGLPRLRRRFSNSRFCQGKEMKL